jgi:hypothetical protein
MVSRIKEFFAQIRDPNASDYSLLFWIVCVFLGGVINAMVIRAFSDFWLSVYNYYVAWQLTVWKAPEIIPSFIISVAIAFSIPILLSFIFTRAHPERRIVPPLPMQIVSFGLLLFFVYNKTETDWQILYGIVFYVLTASFLQDGIITYALGKNVQVDYIIKHSLKVHANVNQVKNIILSKQFRKLNNVKLIDKANKESIKLRTNAKRGFILILELKEVKNNLETIINLVAYHMQAYCVKPVKANDDVSQWATSRIGSLRETLSSQLSVQVEDDVTSNVDSLASFVLEDMAGALSRFQELATTKRAVIVLSTIFFLATIGLFAYNRIDWGLGALGIAFALIAGVALRE